MQFNLFKDDKKQYLIKQLIVIITFLNCIKAVYATIYADEIVCHFTEHDSQQCIISFSWNRKTEIHSNCTLFRLHTFLADNVDPSSILDGAGEFCNKHNN